MVALSNCRPSLSIDRSISITITIHIPRKELSASGGDEGESVWRRLKSTKLMDRWMANKISTPPIFFLIDLQVYTVLVRELYTHCNDRSTNKVAIYSTYYVYSLGGVTIRGIRNMLVNKMIILLSLGHG